MDIQQIILVMVFTSVMGVGLWLRIIAKKAFQIMGGHLTLTTLDTMADLQTRLVKNHNE